MQTEQLKQWSGEFGNRYVERNPVVWESVVEYFSPMLAGLELSRVLEVGCNRGHNLKAIQSILNEVSIFGVEPNHAALKIAREAYPGFSLIEGNMFDIPLKDNFCDLVISSGVLIHIAGQDLPQAIDELYRVSRRYILAVEYFSEELEETVHYHGSQNLCWKRNFPVHFQKAYPDLTIVKQGYFENFDRSHYWVFEKAHHED